MATSKQSDTTDQQETPLPEGWQKAVTPDRRAQFYYVSHNDCYTSWKDPRTYDSKPDQQEQSVLEYIIRAYDFLTAKPEDRDCQRREFEKNGKQLLREGNEESIRTCLNALQEQICVKNFPPLRSVADEMTTNTIKVHQLVMRACIRDERITKETCLDLWFEFLLSLLRFEPGSTASCFVEKILLKMPDIEEHLKALNGEGLTRIIDILKEWHYVPKNPKKSKGKQNSYYLEYCIPELIKIILGNYKSDKVNEPRIHQQFLDLYLFYFTQITEVPDDFVCHLDSAMRRIAKAYSRRSDENPYQVLQKPYILQKHLQTVGDIISSNKFREKHEKMSRDIVSKMVQCIIDKRWTVVVLDDIIDLMQRYFLSDNGHMHEVLSRISSLLRNITLETYHENPQIMNKLLALFQEILQKNPEHLSWAYEYIRVFNDEFSARKGTEQLWFPLLKTLMRTMQRDGVYRCYDTLREQKFKKIWNWKQNYQEALDIIEPLAEIHLHEVGKDDSFFEYCGNTISKLLEQFKRANVSGKLNGRVAELAMTVMEKRSNQLSRFVTMFIRDVELEENQDVIPGLMKRFAVLFYDREYMRGRSNNSFGCSFMENAIKAYCTGREMPDEVNKIFVEMFLWVMQTEGLEYREMVYDGRSVYGHAASDFLDNFTSKHIGRYTSDECNILLPLVPFIMKRMKHEEKEIVESTQSIVYMLSVQDCKLLVGYLEVIVEWYRETRSDIALITIWKTLEESEGFTTPDFYTVMKNLMEDTSNSQVYIHGMVLKFMAERQAELFTQEHVDMMIRRFVDRKETQGSVLTALGEIIAVKPEIFGDSMIKDVLQNPKLDVANAFSVHVIAVNLGLKKKDLVNTIFEELLALAKSWYNPNHQIYLLDSVRILGSKYGVETLRPHRKFFEDLQKFGMTSPIKDTSAAIVNAMDGVSMEGVITDVIQTKRKVRDEKVKKAETEASGVKTTVAEQSKDNKAVETGHEAAAKREDVVGKELEETKVRVEEIDSKKLSNAAALSVDLPKLMNPEGIEEAHQLEETQAGPQEASLPKSRERITDGAAKSLEDDEELPPSYDSLFSQASGSQASGSQPKPSPKSPPQPSKKSSLPPQPPPPPPYPYSHQYVDNPPEPDPEPQLKKKSAACVIT